MAKRSVLGRGLGALMDDADIIKEQISGIAEIELSRIDANPFQPRSTFDQEKLEELSASIREIGLIQPITLRKTNDDRYQIITGERRFRAAQMAGLHKIPAFIREADNDSMLEMALVENIQREDLNPIEISLSYQRLIEECNLTQETLSARIGKKRSTVTNYLRLLKLPAMIQKGLKEKQISVGHAKALINIEEEEIQLMLYSQILQHDYSVRKIEEIVRDMNEKEPVLEKEKKIKGKLPDRLLAVKELLEKTIPLPFRFSANEEGKGKLIITFKSENELHKIVKILENQTNPS
ncbi:MAG: ParB/RepB/Spo0J family partition protein [Prolixibacteraceae bacterium]|jgi:ParB family chromosome partitioning protein|nr:ParB/RepB/Spo0J family partition protein [Prolixibacteraceae bacterium]MDI9562647.1 ParB/RepB/Spo0J family partition protein [Bacteroidota bacterium]NLT00274.1 ParB/RepB/Spo0J family partition protein [Bacteroidales bacterium]OQB79123.1 MAG: Chromosome-partitioning protein Spo0J [Bacteroidetes bacterium ADurb.Bin123]HNZ69160.1 ParB/RepB/Spo0J family partition protein [Prolixibacteraceae bacterium]